MQIRSSPREKLFWICLLPIALLGTFLRLFLLSDQILLNDEWHSLYYVIDRSFFFLLTNLSLGANSIPMNLYSWFLLKTSGWSELGLRLPSVTAGILSLATFPLLVKKLFNQRTTIIFAFLLAVSPFLLFYSRLCRPYSLVVFTGFVSIFFLYFWLTTGFWKYAVLYAATAVLTVYFHVYAAIMVGVPLVYAVLVKLSESRRKNFHCTKIVPALSALLLTAGSVAIFGTLLLGPAYLNNKWWLSIVGRDKVSVETGISFLSLLSGTANPWMTGLFSGFLAAGIWQLRKSENIFNHMLFFILVSYGLLMLVNNQEGIHSAIQVARYCIGVIPICFIAAASGMDQILQSLPATVGKAADVTGNMGVSIFLFTLLWTGPLKAEYATPNNFTNHSAFQESYQSWPREHSFPSEFTSLQMDRRDIPDFYSSLANRPETATIIEYPMYVGDHFNLYYYYQSFHKKKMIAGYYPDLTLPAERNKDFVYGHTNVCEIFSAIKDRRKLKFRNLIDMTDLEAVKQSRADYVILHKNLLREMFPTAVRENKFYQPVRLLNKEYQNIFGNPVFEDRHLIVFKI